MRSGLIFYIAIVLIPLFSFTAGKGLLNTGDLRIEITGLKNKKGQLGILLFDKEDGFPSENEKALQQVMVPISEDLTTFTFKELAFGNYAVAVMHDENLNEELDSNFLGIPKEGTGVSNNIKSKLGPPKFKEARFSVDKPIVTMSIRMDY